MLTVVKEQVIAATTNLAQCPCHNDFRGKRSLMGNDVDAVAALPSDRFQRRSPDLETRGRAAWSGDTILAVTEMDDRSVTKIDRVMLKWDTALVSPNE